MPIIRRCVLNDRDSLFRDIAGLFERPSEGPLSADRQLIEWHNEGEKHFLQALEQLDALRWPVSIKNNHYQLSYLISTENKEILSDASLPQLLKEVNNEVRDTVWTGWSMIYPFTGSENAPAFHPEYADGSGSNVLEGNLLKNKDFDYSLPDFWRVASDGRATLIRAYREDRERSKRESNFEPGTWLSPETVIRETAEFVTHARLLARHFETAKKVSFRCMWKGLKDRELADFSPEIYWGQDRVAKATKRIVEGVWTPTQLAANWDAVVAELACPILLLFGFTECSPALVRAMAPRFIKLGR